MATERDDSLQSISVQLNGSSNYAYWSYVMRKFLIGKRIWGYVSGTFVKPTNSATENYAKELETWEVNNSKIITWINNSVSQSIGFQLAKYDSASQVWEHLKRLYVQSNFAKQYQLEIDIRALQQHSMSIQEFYSAMTNLWDQLALTESAELQAFTPYTDRQEQQRLVQFLMALRNDFEGLRGSILHRTPLPSVDSVVNELLAEEAQCPKLLKKEQPYQPPQWRPPQSKYRNFQHTSQSSNVVAATAVSPSATPGMVHSGSNMSDLVEQFQKFLASQPNAMSVSPNVGLSSAGSSGVGSVSTPKLSFSDVYYIPNLTLSLASVSQLCDSAPTVDLSSFRLNLSSSKFYLWHSRLGHVSSPRLKYLASTGVLGSLQPNNISDCCGCKLAKFSALPFPKSVSISKAPFDLVHSDVWGPSPIATKSGSKYYVSFIDDYTRYCWIFLMKHHSEFFGIYCHFRALVNTQYNSVIKCFRCDLGGEYTSNKFSELLSSDGTVHQAFCTDTPEQNGVAERKHRHILETARSMLLSASAPSEFWGEAVKTAVHVINKISYSVTSGLSPFERMYGHPPDYSSLRVFGSTCFVLLPHVERSKLTPRSAICVFLGYGDGQKGYRCYNPSTRKLYISRHVVFLEHLPFYSIPSDSQNITRSDLIHIDPFVADIDGPNDFNFENFRDEAPHTPPPAHDPLQIGDPQPQPPHLPRRYPQRIHKSTQLPDFVYNIYSTYFASALTSLHGLSEPSSYQEAVLDPLWQ
ncbi:PREDICTED: uncharacterized protein LOC109335479 [Lupinus angustifolius]|uniref:uncharacterized protein LOC109335479 n=1 Tax=Lupinus angustifolius TaxID=3871 RepID=UPI00092F0185|nr:PREDICTED: uncharacterized protein LOC109335479 [Lupinus angustifolius]